MKIRSAQNISVASKWNSVEATKCNFLEKHSWSLSVNLKSSITDGLGWQLGSDANPIWRPGDENQKSTMFLQKVMSCCFKKKEKNNIPPQKTGKMSSYSLPWVTQESRKPKTPHLFEKDVIDILGARSSSCTHFRAYLKSYIEDSGTSFQINVGSLVSWSLGLGRTSCISSPSASVV